MASNKTKLRENKNYNNNNNNDMIALWINKLLREKHAYVQDYFTGSVIFHFFFF